MPWYALHWPRNESRLNGLSLVTPRRSPINRFALSPSGWFAHSDLTVQGLKNTPNPTASDYQPWLTLFNSPLLNCWMHLKGKAKGKIREFYATPLRQIPLPRAEAWKIVLSPTPSDSRSQEAHSFETHQFETHQFETHQFETHQWVCRLYGLSDQEALFVWDSWQKLKP
jgi:hypothetical protein